MPTYSAKKIKKSRKPWWCEVCNKRFLAEVEKIRLFGCAFKPDQPYACFVCIDCAEKSLCDKIKAASAA